MLTFVANRQKKSSTFNAYFLQLKGNYPALHPHLYNCPSKQLFTTLICSGVSYCGEVAPMEGIFYAKPAFLDSESDSDVDTDDAQTVIFKSSPYSSPGSIMFS